MALCLTRRVGEILVIGECEVEILQASEGRARLRMSAPQHVRIYRKELLAGKDIRRAQSHDRGGDHGS